MRQISNLHRTVLFISPFRDSWCKTSNRIGNFNLCTHTTFHYNTSLSLVTTLIFIFSSVRKFVQRKSVDNNFFFLIASIFVTFEWERKIWSLRKYSWCKFLSLVDASENLLHLSLLLKYKSDNDWPSVENDSTKMGQPSCVFIFSTGTAFIIIFVLNKKVLLLLSQMKSFCAFLSDLYFFTYKHFNWFKKYINTGFSFYFD